jgi:hypothetical protein
MIPALTPVSASSLPAEVRTLLDHCGGMTAALEGYWGRPMGLTVLGSRETAQGVSRAVVLTPMDTAHPAELGLISIRLAALPPALHPAVQAGKVPFGRLLADGGIAFESRPGAFFRLRADVPLADIMRVPVGMALHGRATVLRDADGHVLAEAIEILGGHTP